MEGETLTQETMIGASYTHYDQDWGTHNQSTCPCIAFYKANVV